MPLKKQQSKLSKKDLPPNPLPNNQPNQPMKNTTTTALSLPTAVQPKPTKTEIIEAMVQRAKQRIAMTNEEREKMRESLIPKIEAAARKAVKSFVASSRVNIYTYSKRDPRKNHCDVVTQNVTSPELEKLLEAYEKVSSNIYFDEKETRAAIRRELNGMHKPDPTRLLANVETVRAIDTTLDAMGI